MAAGEAPFTVLLVCTGNICRSPIAERVFRARFDRPDVVFASAGTNALVGEDMPPQARAVAEGLGADPGPHSARQVTREVIEGADLVIALARRHRGEVVRMVPRASRYTFTLREAARLSASILSPSPLGAADDEIAGDTPPERLRCAVRALAARRGHLEALEDPSDDDVPDPYRQGDAAFRLAGSLIDEASAAVVAAFGALSAP